MTTTDRLILIAAQCAFSDINWCDHLRAHEKFSQDELETANEEVERRLEEE